MKRQCSRPLASVIVFLLAAAFGPEAAQATRLEAPRPARQAVPHDGVVIVWGGGKPPTALLERFMNEASTGRTAIVATVGEDRFTFVLNWAQSKHIAFQTVDPSTDELPQFLASTVWVDGRSFKGAFSPLDQALVVPGAPDGTTSEALEQRLTENPGLIGVCVEHETALIAISRRLQVSGTGAVMIRVPASATRPRERPTMTLRLTRGAEADIVALSRAAIARLNSPFSPDQVQAPDVPDGTLLVCGGGMLPDVIWRRFIELAGGVDAPIVVLPIATPTPDDPRPRGMDELKRLGCSDLRVLHQRGRREIESPGFADALRRARGVWFAGGRQWKYVDAYEGTVAAELFRGVLRRGGVIGGTSAGADSGTILSSRRSVREQKHCRRRV
jgi:cyanophycinase-like exopeptidase